VLQALVLCALVSAAAAQAPAARLRAGLELTTRTEKILAVAQTDGTTRAELVPAGVASLGDEVVITVSFENVSAQALDGVRITQEIPSGLRYVDRSAIGPGSEVLYSVDGGRTYGQPSELTVAAADGRRRIATADEYTHIRWLLKAPLEAGAKGFARFRAVVRSVPPEDGKEPNAD
jgi:uncharacterized repeat protein (TIGR01451 family)